MEEQHLCWDLLEMQLKTLTLKNRKGGISLTKCCMELQYVGMSFGDCCFFLVFGATGDTGKNDFIYVNFGLVDFQIVYVNGNHFFYYFFLIIFQILI
jgi:hypothetical protein